MLRFCRKRVHARKPNSRVLITPFKHSLQPSDVHNMGRAFLALLFCVLCLGGAWGASWSPDSFPNPKKDLTQCGRDGKPSNICDPDEVLSAPSKDRTEGIIKEIW